MQDFPSIPYFKSDLAATAVLVKGQVLRLETLEAQQKTTADLWIQLFDARAAADVTVGTTTPNLSFIIPMSDGTNYTATTKDFPKGVRFVKGLVIAATTTATGNGAPASNVIVNLTYF